MIAKFRPTLLVLVTLVLSTAQARADFQREADGRVIVGGESFADIQAFLSSDTFHEEGRRCGLVNVAEQRRAARGAPARAARSTGDCTSSLTRIQNEYWPGIATYIIPVWFHIIHRSNGTGDIPDQRIYDQMTVLNEDFGAWAGTLGANGFNVRIQFELAGIDRTESNTWYRDSAMNELAYKTALNMDPNRYLNIYTNDAEGYLGYAYLPQDMPGDVLDGVVMLHDVIGGRDNGFGSYDQGRTLVHEVGHYLGLEHTFESSAACPAPSYSSGDLIVDTNTQQDATYGCPTAAPSSCGSVDPIDNYMGYNDDSCIVRFTAEQGNRAVCSLVNYRPDVYREELDRMGRPTWQWRLFGDQASNLPWQPAPKGLWATPNP